MKKSLATCFAVVFFCAASLAQQSSLNGDEHAPDAPGRAMALSGRTPAAGPLTLGGKSRYFAGQLFSPWNAITPALGAGIEMAKADQKLPREWRQGAGAFGRLYGSGVASLATFDTARFISGAVLHEDPRYFPAETGGFGSRLGHALAFTLFDKSDSGRRMPAVSNFVGAAAGGAVVNLYIPSPYNDPRYAVSRAAVLLAYFAGSNVHREFAPELKRLRNKFHLP